MRIGAEWPVLVHVFPSDSAGKGYRAAHDVRPYRATRFADGKVKRCSDYEVILTRKIFLSNPSSEKPKAGVVKVVASVGEYHVAVGWIDGEARPYW